MDFLAWLKSSECKNETLLEECPATRDLRLEAKRFYLKRSDPQTECSYYESPSRSEGEWET